MIMSINYFQFHPVCGALIFNPGVTLGFLEYGYVKRLSMTYLYVYHMCVLLASVLSAWILIPMFLLYNNYYPARMRKGKVIVCLSSSSPRKSPDLDI